MGVDVLFGVRTADRLTDEQLAEHEAAFIAEFYANEEIREWLPEFRRDYDNENAFDASLMDRYYGVGYARGQWPRIKAMGDWLMARFGEEAEVRYNGDYAHGWDELLPWVEQRAEIEAHWLERGHLDYHRRDGCDCEHCITLAR